MLRIVQIIFTCSRQDQTIDYLLTLSYKMQAQNDLNKLFTVALFDTATKLSWNFAISKSAH